MAAVTGRVLTREGKPAAKAEISFQLIDRHADERVRQKLYRDNPRSTLRTDDQGRFRLEGIPPGEYKLELSHPAGQLRFSQTIEIKAGQTTPAEIRVSPDNLPTKP